MYVRMLCFINVYFMDQYGFPTQSYSKVASKADPGQINATFLIKIDTQRLLAAYSKSDVLTEFTSPIALLAFNYIYERQHGR